MKFHPYSLKVSANVKIARQCFEIFGGGEMSQIPPPWLRTCSPLSVLRSLHGLRGQRCQLVSPRLQQTKHATSTKHLVNWDWSMFKCSDTNLVFQTAIFLIVVLRNNKRSSGIDGKTSDCPSRHCLYYRYLEIGFC